MFLVGFVWRFLVLISMFGGGVVVAADWFGDLLDEEDDEAISRRGCCCLNRLSEAEEDGTKSDELEAHFVTGRADVVDVEEDEAEARHLRVRGELELRQRRSISDQSSLMCGCCVDVLFMFVF